MEIKMKKIIFVTIIASLILALTACGSTQSSSAAATASTTLSQEGQLLVGTFKLEDSTLKVTSAQAATLLPLWETLESLASSNTAASQEVDAVVSQIESTMSSQQVSSITAMKLTQKDLAAAALDTGTTSTTTSSASTVKTSAAQLQTGAGAAAGGNPPSDMGGGMPGATDVQSASQTQTGTSQAAATPSTGTTDQVSAAMIKALVALLQKRIG
jgi:hypothetical protein